MSNVGLGQDGDVPMGQAPLSLWLKRKGSSLESEEPDSIVRYIKGMVLHSQNFKRRYLEPVWLRNLYYVYGAQHIEKDNQGRWTPRELSEDERRVANIMLPRAMHLLSKFISPKPQWTVIPWASTPEEVERAKTSEEIIKAIHEEDSMMVRRLLIELQKIIFGSSLSKTRFDFMGGALVQEMTPVVDGAGAPIMGLDGKPATMPGKWRRQGIIDVHEVSIFDFHCPSSSTSPLTKELPWCAERTAINVSDIYRMYGVMAKPETTAMDPLRQLSIDFTRLLEGGFTMAPDRRPTDCAYVIEYHERASEVEGFEKGIVITIINDKLVDDPRLNTPFPPQQLPWECGYPYEHYLSIPVIGRFHGHSIMSELIQPQDAINKDRRILAIARDLRGIPPVLEPVGSSIGAGAFTSGGPRRIKYTGMPPAPFQYGPLDQALIEDSQTNERDIDKIANLFGPSRGEMMGKSPWSAEALQFFAEAEENDLQPAVFLSSYAYAAAGQKVLQLVKQFMPAERLWAYAGASGEVKAFMAGGTNVPERFRVIVQPDSALPLLKGALQDRITHQMQLGLFGADVAQDPLKQQFLRNAMQMPTPFGLVPPEELTRQRAVRMITDFMTTGTLPQPFPFEDKAVILKTFMGRAGQPDFDKWPEDLKVGFVNLIVQMKAEVDAEAAKATSEQFQQAIMQAVTEAVAHGKFRDADALLLAMKGILERLDEQSKGPQAQGEQGADTAAVPQGQGQGQEGQGGQGQPLQ